MRRHCGDESGPGQLEGALRVHCGDRSSHGSCTGIHESALESHGGALS